MKRVVTVALLLVAAPATAERRTNELSRTIAVDGPRPINRPGDPVLDASIGIGRMWLGLPSDTTRTTVDAAVSVGAYASSILTVSLRGHVLVGTGPMTFSSLGFEARRETARWSRRGGAPYGRSPSYFIGVGPQFGQLRGPREVDALVVALDARVGLVYRGVHVSLDLMPGYAIANDSIDPAADLRWTFRMGVSVAVLHCFPIGG